MRFCFAQSLTAGRNIATTGVLFMNALTNVTGNIILVSAPVTDLGRLRNFSVMIVLPPVASRPATTTYSTAIVTMPSLESPASASLGVSTPATVRIGDRTDEHHVRGGLGGDQRGEHDPDHSERQPGLPTKFSPARHIHPMISRSRRGAEYRNSRGDLPGNAARDNSSSAPKGRGTSGCVGANSFAQGGFIEICSEGLPQIYW